MKQLHEMSTEELGSYFKNAFQTKGKIDQDIKANEHVRSLVNAFASKFGQRPLVIIDGSAWGVIYGDQIDLQAFPSGWGNTIEEALADLEMTLQKQGVLSKAFLS